MRTGLLVVAIGAATALTGCGSTRLAPPDTTEPQPPNGTHFASYPRFGVSLQVPNTWRAQAGSAPLVTSIASGAATVAIWRYPRTEPLPRTRRALAAAKAAL